jgi:putative ABC transport system ATP-binding protein
MIRLEKIEKVYRTGETSVLALKGVDLKVESGDFLSIAGPSGSGKTSLLNILGCLDKASAGAFYFEETSIENKTRKELTAFRREKMGFIFQSYNLIPVLTAFENVSFPLNLLKLSNKEIHSRTMEVLKEVGLTGLENRRPSEMSGGQQQRVAIARALVKKPLIVFADEPTANLDSVTGESILALMRELNSKYGTTFIFSTHDKMVMDFATRLIRLHDGKIASDERK